MKYNYTSGEILSSPNINAFFLNNVENQKITTRNKNIFIIYALILGIISYLTLVLIRKSFWQQSYVQPMLTWGVLTTIFIMIYSKNSLAGLKNFYSKAFSHTIEICDSNYYYKNNNKKYSNNKLVLNNNPNLTVLDIANFNDITIILYLLPKNKFNPLKKTFPLIIPNKIFDSNVTLQLFIDSIKK